jgi:hypothetical protein
MFEGATEIEPDDDPVVTLIVEVPCPEFIVQPDGTVQLYEDASDEVHEKVCCVPEQHDEFPDIDAFPGTELTVTKLLAVAPVPQEFDGTTDNEPEDNPTVTLIIEVPCPDNIIHPEGTVQLYDDASFDEQEKVCCVPEQHAVLPVIDAALGTELTVTK